MFLLTSQNALEREHSRLVGVAPTCGEILGDSRELTLRGDSNRRRSRTGRSRRRWRHGGLGVGQMLGIREQACLLTGAYEHSESVKRHMKHTSVCFVSLFTTTILPCTNAFAYRMQEPM